MMNSVKSSLLFTLCFMVTTNFSLAQECSINEVPAATYNYDRMGGVGKIYDSLLADYSGITSLFLVKKYSQTQTFEGYLLSLKGDSVISAHYICSDSMTAIASNYHYFDKMKLSENNSLPKFYLVSCKDRGLAHMSSLLVISNKKRNIRVEYDELEGDIGESLIALTSPLAKIGIQAVTVFKTIFGAKLSKIP